MARRRTFAELVLEQLRQAILRMQQAPIDLAQLPRVPNR